jgi:hypothetical protein
MKNNINAGGRRVAVPQGAFFRINRIGIKKALFVAVLGLLLAFQAQATNWYVDNAATGSSNGTSWATAWKSFSAVVWGSSGVKAGDTLFISGGSSSKVYTETWSVGASGTAASPIHIAIDAANSSHNGQVIFDYNSSGDQGTLTGISCPRNYITFTGNVNGAANLVFNNLRNIMARTACVAIDASSTTGVVIDHISSTNCNNPIRLYSATGFTVSNCSLLQVRGDAAISAAGSSGSWDANLVYNNVIGLLYNTTAPPGASTSYVGPDGIQCSSGLSIYGNTIKITKTTVYTSDQHPDLVQCTGNNVKVYANEFVNIGDSGFDYDCFSNPTPHDIWIYNNLYRITDSIDPYPEYFRMYASANSISSITNVKILNNTCVDNNFQYRTMWFANFNGNPTGSGNEIKNNLFYNCGGGFPAAPVIYIDNSTAFTSTSFTFDANIYYNISSTPYIVFRGTTYTAANWVSANEPHGKTTAPTVVSYAEFSPSNDMHLQASDTVAKDAGLSFSSYFTTDKDGVARPQGPAWDIGAYEYNALNVPPAPQDLRVVPAN